MQDYFLQFPNIQTSFQLTHERAALSIGSCFSEAIGHHLLQTCFDIRINPFGIVFSPKIIAQQLNDILESRFYTVADLLLDNDLYFSFNHHSSFSGVDRYQVLMDINNEITKAHSLLKSHNTILLLTFGSAFYYALHENNQAVANCHKQAANLFDKQMQLSADMIDEWHLLMDKLQSFNPSLKIVVTVSPVRYKRDGLIENNRSKAQLFSLVDYLQRQFPNTISYFPAYEIVNDCLRDYRFFKQDLVHPNTIAVSEVWQHFQTAYFSAHTKEITNSLEAFNRQFQHRIQHHQSEAAETFERNKRENAIAFFKKYPILKNTVHFQENLATYLE
jgi:hypothetical protein